MTLLFCAQILDIYKTRVFIYSLVEYVIQKTICNLILG